MGERNRSEDRRLQGYGEGSVRYEGEPRSTDRSVCATRLRERSGLAGLKPGAYRSEGREIPHSADFVRNDKFARTARGTDLKIGHCQGMAKNRCATRANPGAQTGVSVPHG